jgi:hypothetical protein
VPAWPPSNTQLQARASAGETISSDTSATEKIPAINGESKRPREHDRARRIGRWRTRGGWDRWILGLTLRRMGEGAVRSIRTRMGSAGYDGYGDGTEWGEEAGAGERRGRRRRRRRTGRGWKLGFRLLYRSERRSKRENTLPTSMERRMDAGQKYSKKVIVGPRPVPRIVWAGHGTKV